MNALLSDYNNYVFGIYLGPPYGKLFYAAIGFIMCLFMIWAIYVIRDEFVRNRKESEKRIARSRRHRNNHQRY